MLPQFGYIVAQAGADSHPPTPNSGPPPPPPPPNSSSNQHSPAIIHHLTESYNSSPSKSNNTPPGTDRNNSMLPPPPPLPYMYSQQQQQQQQQQPGDSHDDYFKRYPGPPLPSTVPHYQQPLPSIQPPVSFEHQQPAQQQNSSHYRPLQPLPPIQSSSAEPSANHSNSDTSWPSSQQQLPHQQPLQHSAPQMQTLLQQHPLHPRDDHNNSRLYGPRDAYISASRRESSQPPHSTVWRQYPPNTNGLTQAAPVQQSVPQHRTTTTPSPRMSSSYPSLDHRNTTLHMQQHSAASPTSPPAQTTKATALSVLETPQSPPRLPTTGSPRPRPFVLQKREKLRLSPPLKQNRGHKPLDWQAAASIEPIEVVESKMLRKIREFNNLISWMDTEFWEQCDEIYKEKFQSLQDEVRTIQDGTHSVFKETLTDIESRREEMIHDAETYKAYELSLTKNQYDHDVTLLEAEYETQRHNLHDIVLQAIEEKKKLVKEDRDESDEMINVKDLFRDAYARIHQKQRLRKRMDHRSGGHHSSSGHGQNGHHASSPTRQESASSRRRRDRQTVPHNIHVPVTTAQEEELETDLMTMKGISVSTANSTSNNNNSSSNAISNTHITSSSSSRRGQQLTSSQHQRR